MSKEEQKQKVEAVIAETNEANEASQTEKPQGFGQSLKGLASAIVNTAKKLGRGIKTLIVRTYNKAKELASKAYNKVRNTVVNTRDKIRAKLTARKEAIENGEKESFATKLKRGFYRAGRTIGYILGEALSLAVLALAYAGSFMLYFVSDMVLVYFAGALLVGLGLAPLVPFAAIGLTAIVMFNWFLNVMDSMSANGIKASFSDAWTSFKQDFSAGEGVSRFDNIERFANQNVTPLPV